MRTFYLIIITHAFMLSIYITTRCLLQIVASYFSFLESMSRRVVFLTEKQLLSQLYNFCAHICGKKKFVSSFLSYYCKFNSFTRNVRQFQ